MEREGIGAPPQGIASDLNQSKQARAGSAQRRRPSEEPALPFWLVSLLFLGLPVTLAGILLVTWMVLFG